MFDRFTTSINTLYQEQILGYFSSFWENPLKLFISVVDILIVLYFVYKFLQLTRHTRVWQLLKGILVLIVVTWVSDFLNLRIVNYILSFFMTYGVIILIIIFQPELRRALEQLGTSKFTKFFGFDKDLETKTKEMIYKIGLAAVELSKSGTGALIVIERDIKIQDTVNTGIPINAEVSPQLIANIFTPNTPLHDGAVIISNNTILAAACMLPMADDRDISKEFGMRHRAALGVAKESDAIAIVVSEETRRISIAKDGTLIVDVTEEALKKILIKSIIKPRNDRVGKGKAKLSKLKEKFKKKPKVEKVEQEKVKAEE